MAVLFHYGALKGSDVGQIALALQGYGVGLLAMVAIKVLAPGFYASQDIRTPVKIAICVLVLTQLLNLVLVPTMAHTGLALSIGLGAVINALWLLVGLIRRGSFQPRPGWWIFLARVSLAVALLGIFLAWGAQMTDWVAMGAHRLERVGLLALWMAGAALLYFGVLALSGMKLRSLLRR